MDFWKSIKSNPYFVTVSSLVFGAVISELYAELQTGHLDFSKVGWERLGTIAMSTMVTSIYHLYLNPPNKQAQAAPPTTQPPQEQQPPK